jgi:exonuclease III
MHSPATFKRIRPAAGRGRRNWISPWLAVPLLGIAALGAEADEAETLRVMTFNLWHGGEAGRQPLEQTIEVIAQGRADVVGLQETGGVEQNGKRPDNARAIAERLAWHYLDQGSGMGVISRHPIVQQTEKKWGVRVRTPARRDIWVFNAHFAHAPYQPYQLLKIPYADAPFIAGADQAVDEARRARGHQVAEMMQEVQQVTDNGATVFITGDFNEPSAHDWTEAVFRAGRCPTAVYWPTTACVLDAGFVDAYRAVNPDPLRAPGYTWTPITAEDDRADRHDRIDFVFVRGPRVAIERVLVVGERTDRADVVVMPYPSDHRAVVVSARLQ